MKFRPEQLSTHFKQTLLPIYIISGDEPLLVQECATEIIQVAKNKDFLEHTVSQVTTQFDWDKFLTDAFTRSLFSAKGIIELRFEQLPNAAATKALQTYIEQLPIHKILIIVLEKLESSTQKTTWFKNLEKIGAFIQIWPIERQQFPTWLMNRARQRGLKLDQQALAILSERLEGNLIAAIQTLDRLMLIAENGLVSPKKIEEILIDQARFNIFDLTDALLQGDLKRAYRIFYFLKEEGTEPLFILSMITKDIRLIARLNHEVRQGSSIEQALKSVYLPPKKQILLRRILPRFSKNLCHMLIEKAFEADQVLKGAQKGDGWQILSEFCLGFKT